MTSTKKSSKKKQSRKGIRVGLILIGVLAFVTAAFFYLLFLSPATKFEKDEITLYINHKSANKQFIKSQLESKLHTAQYTTFLALAEWTGYWKEIKTGRYVIGKGTGVFTLFRKLHGGRQDPLKITINKFRTKNDFAEFIGNKLEVSPSEFLKFMKNNDSISYLGVTQETILTLIIPNTYEIYWNSDPKSFFTRMHKEANKFWTDKRLDQLQKLGLSKEEAITVASIVEEETNDISEKSTVASVYLNRLDRGMPLGADPTVKYAVGNFMLKRITLKHINETASSPYNTYKNKGLPPGPICTPSVGSIDAVLKGEKTDYLYFCAKADFSGSHSFAVTAEEHFSNARKYRKALDSLGIH